MRSRRAVNSAAVKPEEIGQEEDTEVLGVGSEEIQKFGGDVELHELGQVRCTIRREGSL